MKRFIRDYAVGDTVTRREGTMTGVVTRITETERLMSDNASRAFVRVTWSNGYKSEPIPEGQLKKAPR